MFEAQAAHSPDALAVSFGGKSLTYAALDAAANRLAHHLIFLGVGPETIVGIALERSTQMIVAVLAILKAGGAYLPLDPGYPAERLRFMLEDSGAVLTVTTGELAARLGAEARLLLLDDPDLAADLNHRPASAPKDHQRTHRLVPDNLAYVIYTSGSTGRPKGVEISHRNVVRLLSSTEEQFRFGPADVWTLFFSYAFDFSVWEIWGALGYGGRLLIVDDRTRRSPADFLELLAREHVTVLCQTPSAFYALMQARLEAPEARLDLRQVVFAGEALELKRLAPWYSHHGDRSPQLVNMFGATETTVHATYIALDRRIAASATESLVGEALSDLNAYVLDASLSALPVGAVGELYIAGAGLARGYLNRPGLTAERFIACPFGPPGARMYRTGDLARWRADGGLDFLGRADQQVKIRGFRIEPGEIEAVLASAEGLGQVAVVPKDIAGETRLVAYFVPLEAKNPPSDSHLKAVLAERLPDYMIPAAFVPLDNLPLTVNGKLDRNALPSPQVLGESEFRAPASEDQALVCRLFAELTGAARVGLDDNFFALGGHSLLATRLISRLRQETGATYPLQRFFGAPTPKAVAMGLASLRRDDRGKSRPESRPAGSGPVVLSPGQRGLWTLDQIEGASAAYNMLFAWRLRGPLDVGALSEALADLVERHSPLRTVIGTVNGSPIGRLRPPVAAPALLRRQEARASDAPRREAEVARLLAAQAEQPFDLSRDLMLRGLLIDLGPQEHLLALVIHHIASDGMSQPVLNDDLGRAYEARRRGRRPDFAPLPALYSDYCAARQRDLEESGAFERQIDYWRRQLAGAPERLALPLDKRRDPHRDRRAGACRIRLDAERVDRLKAIARANEATLFVVLLAAYGAMLGRFTGEKDILIGSPVAGRDSIEAETMIGFFANTLVLRVSLAEATDPSRLVRGVRETVFGALANADLPFERLVEELSPRRTPGQGPFFQVMFAWHTHDTSALALADVVVDPLSTPAPRPKFDLILDLTPMADGAVEGALEYDDSLFTEDTVRRMVSSFEDILEGLAAGEEPPMRRRLSIGASRPDRPRQERVRSHSFLCDHLAPTLTLSAVFEAQAAHSPDALAVSFGGKSLTYAALDAAANRLAHHLIFLGVGPETIVGIALERSTQMIVAVLAILKAGGAYLPLDPGYPAERLRFMLEDSGAVLTVTTGELAGRLGANAQLLLLDDPDLTADLKGRPATAPEDHQRTHRLVPDNLAYVIYTSGSTGRPKGVEISHRNVVSLALKPLYADLNAESVLLQLAPLAFDAATFEVWGALLNGARLAVAPAGKLDLDLLAEMIAGEGVDTLWLTAGLFAQVVKSHPHILGGIRQVLAGGETLPAPPTRRLKSLFPALAIINGYGPTETTTFACTRAISDRDASGETIPIGGPIRDATAYVLDASLSALPVGAVGELYIAGAGLARGYLNRPGLTAERFIACPFGPPGARMYRTGDLARWRADGGLDFLGRADQQVKIRGFRIEPGEIEAVLASAEGLGQVAVVPKDIAGETRLVAYFVPLEAKNPPSDSHLKAVLAKRLPNYMIPAAFVPLDNLPLTVNGKLDRNALPSPAPSSGPGQVRRTLSPTEAKVAALFSQLLGVDRPDPTASFFDLGGHSLLGVRLIDAIERKVGRKLPLGSLYNGPTIEQLARVIDDRDAPHADDPLVPLHTDVAGSPIFMVQWIERDLARWLGRKRPVYGLSLEMTNAAGDARSALIDDIAGLAARHIRALRTVQPHGPYRLIGHSFGGLVAFEMAQQLHAIDEDVALLGLVDTYPPAAFKERRMLPLREQISNILRTSPPHLWRYTKKYIRRRLIVLAPLTASLWRETLVGIRLGIAEELTRAYEPTPYAGKIHFFKSKVAGELRSTVQKSLELSWDNLALGGVEVHEVPGGHIDSVRGPLAAVTAAAIESSAVD